MICIQVSASPEWKAVKKVWSLKCADIRHEGYVEYFDYIISSFRCRFYKGGSSKTLSAASCQFAIYRWKPSVIIVIGTCGGVDKKLKRMDIILANKTGQYDVIERIGVAKPFFYEDFNITIDNSLVEPEKRHDLFAEGFIATADQDMVFDQMKMLQPYKVAGADWESGAISAICKLNKISCYIFRGVSDIPSTTSDQEGEFKKNTPKVMRKIIETVLPVVIPSLSTDRIISCNLR